MLTRVRRVLKEPGSELNVSLIAELKSQNPAKGCITFGTKSLHQLIANRGSRDHRGG